MGLHVLSAVAFLAVVTHGGVTVHAKIHDMHLLWLSMICFVLFMQL